MKRKTTEEFIDESKQIHGDKYDYSKVNYINNYTKVCIICPKHGFFTQRCINHSIGQGCPICANEMNGINKRSTKELFIKLSKKIHGDKYDYSKVEYINNHTEVCIICPKHGEFWQKPNVHLLNHGCPKCSSSKLELEIINYLEMNKIKYTYQANGKKFNWLGKMSLDFYLPKYNIAIECQGIEHFKEIAFFGGIKKLEETQKRDKIKKQLCEENGIKLFYYSNLGIKYPYKVYENKNELFNLIKNGRK